MSLRDILTEDCICFLNGDTKGKALSQLVDLLSQKEGHVKRSELARAVSTREQLMSTGIGLGIAVPHVRLPEISRPVVVVGLHKAGITDYESLDGRDDRQAFSIFVRQLAEALHAHGRLLSVTVHPKTSKPGDWDGPIAQDWATIGAAVDRFRVMTYGYHWSMGAPGPIAPRWWMEDVLAYATSVVPPNRVYVGLHFYGHDWSGPSGGSVVWEDAQALIDAYGAVPRWQDTDAWGRAVAEPWFSYTDSLGQPHEVWYVDTASVAARLELVQQYGLGGIVIWRLGGEDPGNWATIATTLRPPDAVHPPVAHQE